MKLFKLLILLSFLYNCTYINAIYDPKYPFHPSVNVPFESSNLPIVIIDLDERMADKSQDKRISASMKIIWNKNGGINKITDTDSYDYNGKVGIKYRGNSSFHNSDKKPWGIHLQDDNGEKLKTSILGMGKDNDWALLAPYSDKSLIRDVLTFDLMRGTFEYTPTGKYCEVVLNGVYQGIYIMAARVRQGSKRIDINKPSSDSGDGLTGGYLLEIDRTDEPGFYGVTKVKTILEKDMGRNTYYQYKYPDEIDLTASQKVYIKNLVAQMERSVTSEDFKDPEIGYRDYLDINSLTDYYIAQELVRNTDGYRLSTPMYKYADSKDKRFKFSIWDFNIALGNADYYSGWSTQGWSYNNIEEGTPVAWIFRRILQDETFCDELRKKWTDYRRTRLSDETINHKIDSLVFLLDGAQVRNFKAWNRFNQYVWPNYYIASTWEQEISFLIKWIADRTAWLDSQWSATKVNKVVNGDFESSSTRGYWNDKWISDWSSNGHLTDSNVHEGNYSLSISSNRRATQVITELTPGKYTLKAWVNTQYNADAYLYLRYHQNRNGSDQIKKLFENNMPYHQIEIKDIEVTNNFAELAFIVPYKSNDVRLRIDNVEFFKQEEGSKIHYIAKSHIEIRVDRNTENLQIINQEWDSQILPIEIFNVAGEKIYQGEFNQPSITISNIPAGFYIIKVGNEIKKISKN